MRPIWIGEMLCQSISKFVMRAAGDQAKTACRRLQMCAGIDVGIEGAIHAMDQRRWERNVLELEGWVDKALEEERTDAEDGEDTVGGEGAV